MAWWDASPRPKSRLAMGDAFPRLGPAPDRQFELEQHRASAPPAFEEHVAPPTTPALVVHVDVCFTDPVIRSRYSRSYASSPTFQATNRISRGLVRRIERCCEELITRKDSGALEMFKGDTCERKPQRFDMAFRITTRGKGDWAERTYRSYQKHPLTVAFTKEVILETHRMIGLFLRRHDDKFQWLDCPVSETEAEGGETRAAPFRPGSASLLSVPRAHFMEAAQKFDFVPGYAIELCFRSQNPQRRVPVYERRIQIDSKQTAPLPRFLSEDVLSKALHSINQGLDSKKREFDDHLQDHRAPEPPDAQGDGLEIELKVINNLGPAYNLVQKSIKTHLVLFRDQDAVDCDLFLHHAEKHLSHHRSDADSAMHAMNDFEFRLVELKGFGWTLRDPAKLALGPSASYSRRTIQAALDRIQTGIGDVIRGHNIAMRIKAHKRGHVVLDKAIVAHEKHGKPRETFASRDDAQATFVARLKARIQRDIDRVFEDSCCIDDIPEDEEDSVARPVTPGLSVFEGLSPKYSPSSIRPSLAWQSRPAPSSAQSFSRPRAQRVFSLSRGSRESFMSIDSLTPNRGGLTQDDSRPSTAPSEQVPESPARDSVFEPRGGLLAPAEVKPSQSFSLVLARSPSATHINNRASLVELPTDIQPLGETRASDGMTSLEGEVDPVTALAGNFPEEGALESCSTSIPELRQDETPSRDYKTIDAPSPVPGAAAGKMDTPTTFEDAREYVTSPVSEEKTTSGALFALAQTESTREEDEFSTAPSTPELSTGGSSPRHSMLETPLLPRFDSVARETVLRDTYPDSGTERPAAHLQGESTVEPVLKENRDPSAAPKPHIDQQQEQEPSRLLPSPAEQSTTLKGPEGPEPVPDDANKIHDAEGRTAVTLDETTTPDVHPTTQTQTPTLTTRPSSTTAPKAEPEPEPKPAVSQIDDDTAQLGAETPDISPRFPAPDSPTPEVRTSSHAPGAQEAGHHSESANALLVSPKHVELEPETDATEADGRELGAGGGAEIGRLEEDEDQDLYLDQGDGIHDAGAGALPGGWPGGGSEAVLLGDEVVAVVPGLGTEDVVEAGGQEEEEDKGPVFGEVGARIGEDGSGDGAGVVLDGDEKERLAASEDVAGVDVGPARETDVVGSGGDTLVRAPGATEDGLVVEQVGTGSGTEAQVEPPVDFVHGGDSASTQPRGSSETRSEKTDGSGPGTEVARPGSGDQVADKVADAVYEDEPASATADEAGRHVSGSGTPPELVQSTTEAPEQQAVTQVHGEGPESTTVDAGQGDDALPARETTPAGGPESHGNVAKGDDAGGMHQDVDSEAQVTGPDGEEQLMPDPDRVEEERCESESPSEHPDDGDDGRHGIQPVLSEAPATAPDVRADEAEPAVTHQVMGKSDAVPALDRDAGAEYSVAEISGGAKMGLDVLSAPTEQAEPGQGENDIGDEAGEEPGLAPLGNSVAQPTGLDGREEHLISEEVQSEPTSASALVEPAGTEAPELDIDVGSQGPTTEPTSSGKVKDRLITVPEVTGANPPGLAVGKGVENRLDILSVLAAVADAEVSERGVGEEKPALVLTTPDLVEAQIPDPGASKGIAGQASEVDGTSKEAGHDLASVVGSGEAKRELPGGTEAPVDGAVGELPAPDSELGAGEEEFGDTNGLSRGSTQFVEEEERPSELQAWDQSCTPGSDDQTNGIGGQAALEADQHSAPHGDAGAASDDGVSTRPFQPKETEEIETLEYEDGTVDVDIEPEPQEPQSYNGHAATAASFSNLDTSPQETSTTRAEISNHASSADTTILPTTVPRSEDDSATPKPVSLPPPAQQKPEKPHLAPIPDLSRLFPAAPARTSLSSLSDAASFTTSSSITRNSVDTIRPSADDERQRPGGGGGGMAALPELLPPHTSSSSTRSNSRPRTAAGYLCHLGLCEPRSLEVGLRGALGDVKTRRLSLPLQRMLDKGPPATEKVSGAAAVSGAESEVGGGRSAGSRPRNRRDAAAAAKTKDGAGAVGEGEQSVLPRMMMLLAGAVAIGKIMKSVDERAMI